MSSQSHSRKRERYKKNELADFKSTMSVEDMVRICNKVNECLERGDDDAGFECLAEMPLHPWMAMYILKNPSLGKRHLLESNYNLVDAEAAYGPDWIAKYGSDDN